MKKSFIIVTIAASLLFWNCNSKQENTTDKQANDTALANTETTTENEAGNKEVELNKAQFTTANIKLGAIEQKNLSDVIRVNGKTELPAQNQADVSSFMSGTITNIYVNLGDKVKKGQVIASIDSPEFIQLQEEYLISKNTLEYLELEYQRQQTLRAENVNSAKIYQKTKADLNIERARYQSLSNRIKLVNTTPGQSSSSLKIVAPISGNIATIPVKIGTNVMAGQSLFTLVDNSQIHLDLMVYEKDLASVHIGQKVSFNLTNIDKTEVTATIFSIGKSFEPGTKTVAVHANIDNIPDNLITGLYVNALIQTGHNTVDVLPSDAIVKADGREFIFYKEKEDENTTESEHFHFERVEVKTGVSELGYTQVTILGTPPKDGEIVVKGAYYLQSHLIKNEGGGGHEH